MTSFAVSIPGAFAVRPHSSRKGIHGAHQIGLRDRHQKYHLLLPRPVRILRVERVSVASLPPRGASRIRPAERGQLQSHTQPELGLAPAQEAGRGDQVHGSRDRGLRQLDEVHVPLADAGPRRVPHGHDHLRHVFRLLSVSHFRVLLRVRVHHLDDLGHPVEEEVSEAGGQERQRLARQVHGFLDQLRDGEVFHGGGVREEEVRRIHQQVPIGQRQRPGFVELVEYFSTAPPAGMLGDRPVSGRDKHSQPHGLLCRVGMRRRKLRLLFGPPDLHRIGDWRLCLGVDLHIEPVHAAELPGKCLQYDW